MKRLFFFLFCFLACLYAWATSPSHMPQHLRISTRSGLKNTIDGTFDVTVSVVGLEKTKWNHAIAAVPVGNQGWFTGSTLLSGPPLPDTLFVKDSVVRTVRVNYNSNARPYYYQKIRLEVKNLTTQKVEDWVYAYIYFTPWDKVEIWGLNDWELIKRVWDSPHNAPQQRVYVNPNQVPVSNLSNADYINPQVPKEYVSIPGLAYSIPMHAQPDPPGKTTGDVFSGTVTGTVTTTVVGDPSLFTITLGIRDIKVVVMRKRAGIDKAIAEGYTEDDGSFSIDYSVETMAADVKLYLKIEAVNEAGNIKVRRRLGDVRSETQSKSSPFVHGNHLVEGNHSFGTFTVDNDGVKPQLLHWAGRSRQLMDDQVSGASLPGSGDWLDIFTSFTGSGQAYFIPGGYEGEMAVLVGASLATLALINPALVVVAGLGMAAVAVLVSDHDCLYIGQDNQLYENTTYHEFGHYVMWHLQGESWVDLFEGSFAVHSTNLNSKSEKLAWTEGFASGFGAIVDAWAMQDDNEFGTFGGNDYENRIAAGMAPEAPLWTISKAGVSTSNEQAVTHGFVSEWSIAAALYDLWDGYENLELNGNPAATATDHFDNGSDDVELSLADIMAPLMDRAGTGGFHSGINDQERYLLVDVVEYHEELMNDINTCALQRSITESMHFNGIRNMDKDLGTTGMPSITDSDLLNVDSIYFTRLVSWDLFKDKGFPNAKHKSSESEAFKVNVTELLTADDDYNFTPTVDPFTTLVDDLLVNGDFVKPGATLGFNQHVAARWRSASNTYGQPVDSIIPAGHDDFTLCGLTLEVKGNSKVVVGDAIGSSATVKMEEGGTLILGGGGCSISTSTDPLFPSEHVSGGSLIIHDNSRLILDASTHLIIRRGADIQLLGNNAVLEIRGDITLEDSTLFSFVGSGHIEFGLPDYGGSPNVSVGERVTIRFTGAHDDDKVIHIYESTYFMPEFSNDSLTMILRDGFGFFSGDAFIDVASADFTMRNFDIAGGYTFHKGITVNGYYNDIEDIHIEDAYVCFRGKNIASPSVPLAIQTATFYASYVGIRNEDGLDLEVYDALFDSVVHYGVTTDGSDVILEDCEFYEGDHAVVTVEGSASLTNCTFEYFKTGWHCTNTTSDVEVVGGWARYNDYGYKFMGSGFEVEMTETEPRNNDYWGVMVSGPVTFSPTCTRIYNNYSSGLYLNAGAVLDAEQYAYNEMTANYNANVELVSAGMPLLELGNNDFTSSGSTKAIKGTIQETCQCIGYDTVGLSLVCTSYVAIPSYGYIVATENTWNGSLAAPTSSDYNITTMNPNCSYTLIDGAGGAPYSCASPMRVAATTAQPGPSLAECHAYLTADHGKLDVAESERLKATYTAMRKAFAADVASGKADLSPAAHRAGMTGAVKLLLEAIDAQLAMQPAGYFRDRLVEDKARLYYHVGQVEAARGILGKLQNRAEQPFADHYAQLDCQMEAKAAYLRKEIDAATYFDWVVSCAGRKAPEAPGAEPGMSSAETASLQLFPNPTGGNCTLRMNGFEGAGYLEVLDMSGKVVMAVPFAEAMEIPQLSLDLSDQHSGMYLVRVRTAGQVAAKRLVVSE